jgi:hypothetical protein
MLLDSLTKLNNINIHYVIKEKKKRNAKHITNFCGFFIYLSLFNKMKLN